MTNLWAICISILLCWQTINMFKSSYKYYLLVSLKHASMLHNEAVSSLENIGTKLKNKLFSDFSVLLTTPVFLEKDMKPIFQIQFKTWNCLYCILEADNMHPKGENMKLAGSALNTTIHIYILRMQLAFRCAVPG